MEVPSRLPGWWYKESSLRKKRSTLRSLGIEWRAVDVVVEDREGDLLALAWELGTMIRAYR